MKKIHTDGGKRSRKCEASLRERGGKRLPGGSLQPDAAAALDALYKAGYAPSLTSVIAKALIDAHWKSFGGGS